MRNLYHFTLCPFSRKVRILLNEKNLEYNLISEEFWKKTPKFLSINPIGQVPVLIDDENSIIDSMVICEFLEEKYGYSGLLGKNYADKAEVRRLVALFDQKMFADCVKHILFERVIKYFSSSESPNSSLIRVAKNNLSNYLSYIKTLLMRDQWIAGNCFTIADIAIASHISVLDYFGDVPWSYDSTIKDWYSVVKSRPSFRAILQDKIAGFKPNQNYEKLDF